MSSPHGPLRQLDLEIGSEKDATHCIVTFAVPDQHPILLWKILIENRGSQPIEVKEIELLSAGYIYRRRAGPMGRINFPVRGLRRPDLAEGARLESPGNNLAFFSNGWQSWSFTGRYLAKDRYRQTHLGFIRSPMVKNASTPHPGRSGVFTSDMFGVLGELNYRNGLLAGFLSQKQQFGSLETWIGGDAPTLRLWASGDGAQLAPGRSMSTDWACVQFLHLDTPDPMSSYLEAVAREHGVALDGNQWGPSPTGWCSWYQFSTEQNIGILSAEDISRNLDVMQVLKPELPFEIIQIDDGFESQVGDWFNFNESFPDGVTRLARDIRAGGFQPGIWLAPFVAHPGSRLARGQPDWLLRNWLGLPINAGFSWRSLTRALDLTHPDVIPYIQDVVHAAVSEWEFNYLKLDYLYAAALSGCHKDATLTRAQVLRAGLEGIRNAAGKDTFLLGCGCPLGPAIGLVDGMRVSADTAKRWRTSFSGFEFFIKDEPSTPSAFNAVHNSLTRSVLHRRWWINDPDCLLLRLETNLTQAEVETIASVIALTGGSMLLSDHLPDLPPERLRIAMKLLPLIGKRPYILDWFDSSTPERVQLDLAGPVGMWHLLALFNWKDVPQDMHVNLGDCYLESLGELYAREFWSGEIQIIQSDQSSIGQISVKQVSPHGVRLFALRPRRPHSPQYLGSDLHISQGLEVIDWQTFADGFHLRIQRPGRAHGRIELATPRLIAAALLDGTPIHWGERYAGRYIFDLKFIQETSLEITYQ